MSLITPQNLFHLSMMLAGATFVYLPSLLIMHLLMPQEVVQRYWKWPHFGPTEIALCTEGICAPLRTQKLIATMVFPIIARKRGFEEGLIVPRWYLMAARALIAWVLTAFIGFMSILIGLNVYGVATGRIPVPDLARFSLLDTVMLVAFLFSVAFFIVRRWWPKQRRSPRRHHEK